MLAKSSCFSSNVSYLIQQFSRALTHRIMQTKKKKRKKKVTQNNIKNKENPTYEAPKGK